MNKLEADRKREADRKQEEREEYKRVEEEKIKLLQEKMQHDQEELKKKIL